MHPFFAINRLSAYLDGDLPRRERLEVERVLSRHPELEAELLNVQNAVRLVSQAGPARAPRRLVPEVLQALEERQQSPFQGPDRMRNILLGLGVTMVIATGLAVWMGSSDVTEVPQADAIADATIDDFLDDEVDDLEPEAGEASEAAEAFASDEDSAAPSEGFGDAGLLSDGDDINPGGELEPVELPEASQPMPTESRMRVSPPRNAAGEIEPFIPNWDKAPVHEEAGSSTLLQVAVYRVYANSADIMKNLHELAQANGTLLTDSMGNPIQIRSLSGGDDFASAHLTLPAANMEVFLSQLARLGLAVEVSPPEAGAERQSLLLEVMYKP